VTTFPCIVYLTSSSVAGIIGAKTYGVAPKANLISVKVANDDATMPPPDRIAAALSDVIDDHVRRKEGRLDDDHKTFRFRGSVINISMAWKGESDASGSFPAMLRRAAEEGIKVYVSRRLRTGLDCAGR